MTIKSAFSFVSIAAIATFGVAACSASTDDPSTDPAAESQDEELKQSVILGCAVDSDCVAVPRGGCCDNGFKEAVNKHHTRAYANSTKCTLNPHPFCPLFLVHDTRVAQCDSAAKTCKMFAVEDIKCGGFIKNAHQC